MSEMNAAFQPGVVLDVMTLYRGNKFLVRNDTDLLKMWKMSDVESLWDVHFYIEQRNEVPLGIVNPIDLDAIPEVLLIDSDDDAHIEEIATQVEPIVEPIISNIQAQIPKKLVTKPRLKKKKTLLKLVDEEDVEQVQVEVQVPERVQDQENDDEVIVENIDVGGNTVGEEVEDMGGNTVDGEHRGGVGDMGVNTDNWAELDPENLNAEEGYYSTHTSQDGDDGPTQENIDKCDLEFRDIAKEYDNIFAEEEDAVHSVPPQPTYGELRVEMEWATVRTTDGYTFTLRKRSNLKHACNSGAKNRLANATWVAKQVESVMRPVVGLDGCFLKGKYGGVPISYWIGWFCFRHMYKNMKTVYRGTHLESLVWKAARAYKQVEKKNLLDELKLDNPSAHDWLMKEPFEHWARSHFDFTANCEHITNNFFESFNNWIFKIMDKPLHKALEKLNLMLMKLMFDRRQKAKDWEEKCLVLVPRAQTHIDKLKRQYGQYRIEGTKKGDGNTGQYVAIAVSGQRWRVNLGTHECDCHEWQVTGLPCVHTVFVSEYHKVSSYVKTYKDVIYPVVNPSEWGQPQPPYFLPPPLVRGPGRPREERIHDPDEKRPHKRCGTCGCFGHNKTCKGPPVVPTPRVVRTRQRLDTNTSRANFMINISLQVDAGGERDAGRTGSGRRTGRNTVGGRTSAREGGDRGKTRGRGSAERNTVGGRTGARGGGDRGKTRGGGRTGRNIVGGRTGGENVGGRTGTRGGGARGFGLRLCLFGFPCLTVLVKFGEVVDCLLQVRGGTKRPRSDDTGILDGQRVGDNPVNWATDKGFRDRPIVKEQIVDIKSVSEVNAGYARVFTKFRGRNWTKILTPSGKVYPRIVRLFYATLQLEHVRILYSQTFSVTIDGTTFTVTRDSIYAILGFRPSQYVEVPRCIWPASYYPWPAATFEGEFEEDGVLILPALPDMVIDITAQHRLYTGSGIVSRKMLDDESRLVHSIVITNIIPRSQKNELSERMKVFLYAFKNDIELDLPNIINEEMIDASTKMATRSSLPFARLVLAILSAAGYKVFPNEPEDTKNEKLDASNCHKSASHLPSVLPSKPAPPGEHIGSSSSAAQPQEVFSFQSIGSMLQTVSTRFGAIEGRMGTIEDRLETIETDVRGLRPVQEPQEFEYDSGDA
ncbi:hypothetical protein GIB67_021574 [Kingdonia uniflora]|uniref:SWIM-type domain-containing protein n=1 Tax=Kingdonia uniflora TaxID=39325 RepID=A0A7J7MDG7_9MAGN|nr:hypothetical protein GIB67_021574 [Kingdonia uniflora]